MFITNRTYQIAKPFSPTSAVAEWEQTCRRLANWTGQQELTVKELFLNVKKSYVRVGGG
ncbi:MAG: hypothetical protein LBG28_07470 [Tannerella sp.]|jgi:hypothetical protein|nr:hypothetical protein [Tannerella sp.]